jgi:WD40 repeat protein
MGESLIVRKGGGGAFEIDGQQIITGEYAEAIEKFDTVGFNLIPESAEIPPQLKWDTETQPITINFPVVGSVSIGSVGISQDGEFSIIGVNSVNPRLRVYIRSNNIYNLQSNPSIIPTSDVKYVSFSQDGNYLALAVRSSPFVFIYVRSGNSFVKLANPATLPTGEGNNIVFSPDGTYLAIAHASSPFITIYKRNGNTFTKLTNPSTLPPNIGEGVQFSTDNTYLVVGHRNSPFITIYKRSGDTFTKLPNPEKLPLGTAETVSFSKNNEYLAVTHLGTTVPSATSREILMYKRNGDVFTELPNLGLNSWESGMAKFIPNSDFLSVTNRFFPLVNLYKVTDDIFTKTNSLYEFTNRGDIPQDSFLQFSSDGAYVIGNQNYGVFSSEFKQFTVVKTTLSDTVPAVLDSFYKIYKANNQIDSSEPFGYALESGTANETKSAVVLFDGLGITNQKVIEGKYGENISKFDTVAYGFVVENPDVKFPLRGMNSSTFIGVQPEESMGSVQSLDYSSDGKFLAVGHFTSPHVSIWKQEADDFKKVRDPAILPPGFGSGVSFSPDTNFLAVKHSTTPFISIYVNDRGIFRKLANPATLPTNNQGDAKFSPDGNYLAVAQGFSTPYLTIYKRNGSSFIKLADPSDMPTGEGRLAFSPDGVYLAVKYNASPFLTIYTRDGDTFTKIPDLQSMPGSGFGNGITFSPDSVYLAMGSGSSVMIYKKDGTTFTLLNTFSTSGTQYGLSFSSDGNYLSLSFNSSPGIRLYKRNGDVFTELPITIPDNQNGRDVSFSPNGTYLAHGANANNAVTVYKNLTTLGIAKVDNSLVLPDGATDIGYALEDGTTGQTKKMVSLFKK